MICFIDTHIVILFYFIVNLGQSIHKRVIPFRNCIDRNVCIHFYAFFLMPDNLLSPLSTATSHHTAASSFPSLFHCSDCDAGVVCSDSWRTAYGPTFMHTNNYDSISDSNMFHLRTRLMATRFTQKTTKTHTHRRRNQIKLNEISGCHSISLDTNIAPTWIDSWIQTKGVP